MMVSDYTKNILDIITCVYEFSLQISAAMIQTIFFYHTSANIAHNSTNTVSRPMICRVNDHYWTSLVFIVRVRAHARVCSCHSPLLSLNSSK